MTNQLWVTVDLTSAALDGGSSIIYFILNFAVFGEFSVRKLAPLYLSHFKGQAETPSASLRGGEIRIRVLSVSVSQ